MKWVVKFAVKPDESVEVEGDDRWAAVVNAAEMLGLGSGEVTLSALYVQASVKKLERKKRLAWWEKQD